MLPFDTEVLTALVEEYNRSIWPAQIPALLLALGVVALAARPVAIGGRLIGLVLAAGWAWTGAMFHLQVFAPINFAAPIYGWLFIVEAGLLLFSLVISGRTSFAITGSLFAWVGLVLALAVLVLAPLAEGLLGGGWAAAEITGLTPDTTAVFTLALLLTVRGRAPLHLVVLPFLWSLVAAVAAWMLETPGLMVLPAAGIAAAVMIVGKNRRAAG